MHVDCLLVLPGCEQCGLIAVFNEFKKQSYCPVCGDESEINFIEMSYAFKLLLDEMKSLDEESAKILKAIKGML